jgi:PAS domain S-box-containing protein
MASKDNTLTSQKNPVDPQQHRRPPGMPRWLNRILPSSISGRLILLLCVILVPLLLVEAVFYYSTFEGKREGELQANLEVARAVSGTFDAYIRDILRQELAIGIAFTSPEPLSSDQEYRFLEESVRDYPTVVSYAWLDPAGLVSMVSPTDYASKIDTQDYFGSVVQGQEWVASDLFQEPGSQQPRFAVLRAMRSQSGELQGAVVAVVDPERLVNVLSIRRTEQGEVSIIDRSGRLVYRYPDLPQTWAERDWLKAQPIIGSALKGTEVSGILVWPVDAQVRMVGLAPISSIGWAASASRPEASVMSPFIQDLVRDAGFFLMVAIVAVLVALVIGRSFTKPISRLKLHALALGRGDLERPAETTGLTEVDDLAAEFNHMVSEIKMRQEALSTMATIVESSYDAIISETLEGTIASWNPAAESLFGYTADEIKGKPKRLLIPPNRPDELPGLLERIRRGEVVEHYETQRLRKDGSLIDILATISPITDRDGEITGLSMIARDITEAKREVEKARNDLLSTVSHELRTPLTLIRTCVGLLLDSHPDPTMQDRLLRNIKQSSDRMHVLVSDTLDLVRLRAGRIELQLRYVDTADLVDGAAALMKPLVDERQQRLEIQLPSPAPVVMGDHRRLEQVLINLLSNANKFSPVRAIIRVALEKDNDELIFSVSDTGPGMPPEVQAQLFEQFYTARTSSPSQGIGAGLGLPIVKGLVEAHGGRIWVKSEVGVGSIFFFSLPTEGPRKEGSNEDTGG